MANAIYPKYKEALLTGDTNISLTTGTVKIALVDTGTYTYSSAHQFYSDLSGVTANSTALGTKTVTDGYFDSANAEFTAVSGNQSEALIFWIDTGNGSTSRLVAYLDTNVTGLPVTPNGGDITVVANNSGWFLL
jgi:hypothetical protein